MARPPFGRILIANRGEIACRVISTAKRMGIATVAVYSEPDREARHVRLADEAVPIGPAEAARSYLDIGKIIAAARDSGAEAVHPGYGFLSENPAFMKACEDAGITFIGPNAEAIALMGDKIRSRLFAAKAGVSIIPGFDGEVDDEEMATKVAAEIGYPVMIKAAAGGGGKGMRIAHNENELREGFAAARSEAQSAFGDARILIEKFIENPRHIEIQVLADRHGNVIHLGERECSIQRRNQKIIEEAPSPLLDADTRQRMGAQAVALARAAGYDSAGTVEFVAGPDKRFYFLEMNTRLQVEHPVTEMITGLDLVEWMIRIAAGEELPLSQEDVKITGWAVESRIYAEDPRRDFLPSIGRLSTFHPPREEDGAARKVRLDTGVEEGSEISIHYDPLIAKLVTWGPDRTAAIAAQADALDAFAVRGITHNIGFLAAIMDHPRFSAGDLSTAFIAEEYPDGFDGAPPSEEITRRLAVIAAAMGFAAHWRSGADGPWRRVVWFDELRKAMPVMVTDDESGVLRITPDGGAAHAVRADWRPGLPVWKGRVDDAPVACHVHRDGVGWRLMHRGVELTVLLLTERQAQLAELMPAAAVAGSGRQLLSPMPGRVLSVAVEKGRAVKAGEPLCVVEAMKMENILRAERDAIVAAVHVAPGDLVAADQVLMEFAAPDGDA